MYPPPPLSYLPVLTCRALFLSVSPTLKAFEQEITSIDYNRPTP